jgi:nucleoside-diphosphate-sugar epimerase
MVSSKHEQFRVEEVNRNFWLRKKVLVTGGAGFIGSNLVERLLTLGATVRVVDNLERGKTENLGGVLPHIDFVKDDFRQAEACQRACRGMDVVIHLAAKVGGIKYYLDHPGDVLIQNVLMDNFMLQAAIESNVQSYLYASSAHVYPKERQMSPDTAPLCEEDALPANPDLSYGWAKLLGEKQIEYMIAQGTNLKAAIVRLIGAYGKNQDLDLETGSAIPVFIRRAVEYPRRTPFLVWGNGEETRSYCYIDDVLDGMLLAVEKLDTHRLLGPINLGSEGRIKMGELAEEVIKVSGKNIRIVYDNSKPTLIWGQAVDCSKARQVLDGWKPNVPMREGLRLTYEHVERKLQASGLNERSSLKNV